MRTSLRKTLGVLATSTAVVALAACSGGSGGGGSTTLVLRQMDPPAETQGLQAAIDSWNESHPDVQVEMESLSGPDAMQQFAREANSGSGPDLIQMGFVNVKDLATPRILTPLDEQIEASEAASVKEFLARDIVTIEDQVWGIPWTVDTYAMAYRADQFADAGVEVPTTWDELATAAQTLAEQESGRSGFCFPGSSSADSGQWFAVNYWLWSHDAALIEDAGGTWQVGMSPEQAQEAIDWFNDLFASGATQRSLAAVSSLTDPQIVDATVSGSCSATMMAPQTYRSVREDADIVTAPMPDGLTDGATHLGGRALGINASTDHPDEAWELLTYLTSEEAFATIEQYPASVATLDQIEVGEGEEGYVEQLPHAETFARYLEGPLPVPTLQKMVTQEFGAVYSGQKDSATAAQDLIDQIQAELDRA